MGVRFVRCLAVVALMALMPSLAHAQSSITGTIRDASGAVLPGVTVEAASPVLIEKVRSTVSDGTGGYRLTELLPGTYSLTFTLPGFATVKRDGVEITGAGVITINADLRVGDAAGNDHGHRRDADRRRAEHAAAAGHRRLDASTRCPRRAATTRWSSWCPRSRAAATRST